MQSHGDSEHFEQLARVLLEFVREPIASIEALGQGHIHETYHVRVADGAGTQLVLQRLNAHVFPNLDAVMDNIVRVTTHARRRLERQGVCALHRRVLTLRRTRAGKTHHCEPRLGSFRVFDYIAGSLTMQRPDSASDVYEAGRACAEFATLLEDLPACALQAPLPDFHATDRRFEALQAALVADPVGRAAQVCEEARRIAELESLARECARGSRDAQLPVRITHNDTKLNNILFDAQTRRALCLVDLDTVMPGFLAYDFGDLVRTCLCSADEDERDLARVALRADWIEPLTEGYLSAAPAGLTDLERASLARGPLWIVLELAMRFLTDFVLGDRYFRTARAGQNLDRARVQLALLSQLLGLESRLRRAVLGG